MKEDKSFDYFFYVIVVAALLLLLSGCEFDQSKFGDIQFYSFFFLIPPLCGFLVWRLRKKNSPLAIISKVGFAIVGSIFIAFDVIILFLMLELNLFFGILIAFDVILLSLISVQ
jgi:hypothetical protein